MVDKEVDLQDLQNKYPCNKRGGYAKKDKCKCKDNDKVIKTRIKCLLKDKNIHPFECSICVYQKNYEKNI